MLVMNRDGDLFDDRIKQDRSKLNSEVPYDRRT